MKKFFKSLAVVAVAAMGLVACQNEFDEPNVNDSNLSQRDVVLSFVADAPTTRTSVDTSSEEAPVFSWDDDETFAILEQTDALAVASNVTYEKVDGKANIAGTFVENVGKGEYKYVMVYPATGYVTAESIEAATLSLPAVQTMAANSYDPDADLMASKVVAAAEQPTDEAQQVQFTRLAAVVKMTLKNFTLETGDQVERVIFTAEGKALAGTVTADLNTPHEFAVAEGVDSVSVATTSADEIYFTVLPTAITAGENYTITVVTNKYLYVKQGTISEDKSLTLEAGMVNRFGVNMDGVEASEKWVLVRDASTLAEGDVVTIATKSNNFVMGCSSAANFPYASYQTNVVKVGDYLYHPITADKSRYQYMVQPLTLAKQDAAKAMFDFYNGVDYEGDTKIGYLSNAQTDNYLKLSEYPSKNTSFAISIEDGVATIEAKDSEWDNTLLRFYNYNPNSSTTTYRRFVCIDEASINDLKHDDVCLYKLVGAKGVVPVAGADISVPDADSAVVVAQEGVTEQTTFEDVKFNYVGDWAIEATTDAEWLTLNYENGSLSYLAEANDGTARYAIVTITATLEGEEEMTWTFNVVQKGAPVKVTIAEFIEKEIDANVEYEVTGILTKKATSASGSTTIADAAGNTATFKYIDMANGDSFIENESIALGDIVTIVAAVSADATGGSSSAHAICKGYYNLEAVAVNDLVGYDGGSVEVTLNKLGTLAPAGDITAKVSEEFAELKYTTNADKATITLAANSGAPRQVVVTFTDGYAETSVVIVQSADIAKGNTWELVADASTLEAGDQLIIAAKEYDVAMSTTIASERRSAVAVTKMGNYYLAPAATTQTLVLANGSAQGTFAFYDGVNKGYLVSTSTSYELNNQAYVNDDASFTITIADGVATIGNKEGDFNENKLCYREGSSYNYFYSGETEREAISLYRLVGVKGTIPVTPADVVVPTSTQKVVIPEEGAVEATPIDDVVFNYVGEWTISATSEADWVSFAFDKANNKLTYTAEVNTGAKRETSVTITASMEGQESLTWSFNVIQKGVPQDITIAEFIKLTKDENSTYKLTGRITEMTTSSSGTFKLADSEGNIATITYLYTDDGVKVSGNTDIGVAVGDVMTVTTVPVGSAKGGNNSHYSIYKGHYGFETTLGLAADYTGGSVEIAVATYSNGNITTPDAVTATMAESDFAELLYSGGDTAIVNFNSENTTSEAREVEVTFTYGLTSVTLIVQQGINPANKLGYELVTDASTLAVEDEVIIVAVGSDKALGCYTGSSSITGISTLPAVDIVKSGKVIYDVEEAGVMLLTLKAGMNDGEFAFQFTHKDSNYYLNAPSSGLKGRAAGSGANNSTSYAITIDAATGVATVQSTYPRIVKFNSKTGTNFTAFKLDAEGATLDGNNIAIYKKQK